MFEYLLYAVGFLYLFWLLYVFTMNVYRAKLKKRLTRTALVLAFPFVILAVLMDLVAQLTFARLVFREKPRYDLREWLVTARLARYLKTLPPDDFRYVRAQWICENILDPFDPDFSHCVPALVVTDTPV